VKAVNPSPLAKAAKRLREVREFGRAEYFAIRALENRHNLRSANRNRNTTDNRNNNLDFRVGRTLNARAGTITVTRGAH
jgi:hypothetical protein